MTDLKPVKYIELEMDLVPNMTITQLTDSTIPKPTKCSVHVMFSGLVLQLSDSRHLRLQMHHHQVLATVWIDSIQECDKQAVHNLDKIKGT